MGLNIARFFTPQTSSLARAWLRIQFNMINHTYQGRPKIEISEVLGLSYIFIQVTEWSSSYLEMQLKLRNSR